MKRSVNAFTLITLALVATPAASARDLQESLAAAKQAAARNQQALRAYTWIEKTELSLKGEVKSSKIKSCRYGSDGRVEKTPLVEPPPPEKKRGVKGRVVAKKTGEIKAELEAAAALAHRYVPPDPEKLQAVIGAGTAALAQAGPGVVALKFLGYEKPGDGLTLTFESAVKTLRQIDVTTWLDKPSDTVTLQVQMHSLPDGTDYPGAIVLGIPSSRIKVKISKSNYQKLAR